MLVGYAQSELLGFDDGESTIVVSDETWNTPLVIIEGLKGKKLSQMDNAESDVSLRKLGTYFKLQPDLTLLDSRQARDLCLRAVGTLGQVDRQVLIEIEIACFLVIKRVLQQCPPDEASGFAWNFQLF